MERGGHGGSSNDVDERRGTVVARSGSKVNRFSRKTVAPLSEISLCSRFVGGGSKGMAPAGFRRRR
ncbi:hypothetical protein NCGM1179_2735 [Pseudomonas aeruginosa NCMG1179]|nr:hypothetical protein EU515_11115 [Pseudomonas aeruginosa]GAA17904.1 hypothetical protein NCGM1179_2735 [Pseudomonas aeruginosa NCMG1179]